MLRMYGRLVTLAGVVAGGLGPTLPAEAQMPDKFTNLQVLPKDTGRPELVGLMRSYASALGVRCEQCHVGAEAPDFKGTDFASDAKESKRTARLMMKMVRAINEESLPQPRPAAAVRVECVTCHRGQKVPRTLEAEVSQALEEKGAAAAVARYRELRAAAYGRGGYDFGQGTLNQIGERLLKAGRAADAQALLELNLEFFPDAPWTLYLAGEARRALGQADQARAAYQRSAALGRDNPMPRQRLQALPPQAEPDFKNVRHFTGLTPPELQRTMNFMRASLGVHCDFCHVVTKEAGWQWEKDDKPAKQTARKMIEMVEQLNRDRFAGQAEVSCYTCHRGHQRPVSQPPLPQPPPSFPTVAEAAPPGAPPSAESVWQRFRETVRAGPRPATRVLKGKRVGGKESSDLEIREKGERALILVASPRGRLEQVLDGGEGWVRDEKETRALTADERAGLRDILGTLAFPPDEPRGAKVVAKEAVDGRAAWVLEWMPAPGRTQRLYFDAESGLLARREELTRRKVGWVPERIDYADYREVGGTKVPATITTSYVDPWIGATRTFTEILPGAPVDDAVFARPPAAAGK
jgi:hypothetical protein